MTQQSKRPDSKPASAPKIEQSDALPDAALEQVAGGKPQMQSDITTKFNQTQNGIAQNIKG